MTILYQQGDEIHGEVIMFKCRSVKVQKKAIAYTHTHKGQSGVLRIARCIIEKRFTTIPERTDNTNL